MPKFDTETVNRWKDQVNQWFHENLPWQDAALVQSGVDAWTIAHRAGITREAYVDRDVTDGHIQTALEKIFPNAVFKDRKTY